MIEKGVLLHLVTNKLILLGVDLRIVELLIFDGIIAIFPFLKYKLRVILNTLKLRS